jgi:hydrogenase maturation protein HypF
MRLKACVRGAVQGVGFRPFVHRLASELSLAGWVNNSPQGVFIEVEGPRAALEQFLLRLEAERPPHSFIQSLESSWLDPVGYADFEIRASDAGGDKTALVLPDIATCPDCIREILDPANRRYRYPFTNCTHCGPRFSIITALPYDRANTTMAGFKMCAACHAEYEDPCNRRFHAQPNACPVCGPRLELWEQPGESKPRSADFQVCRIAGFQTRQSSDLTRRAGLETGDTAGLETCATVSARDHEALLAAAAAIRAGRIVAVKGLGGFHLMVDARNEAAVQRLRQRKHREEKPLALMFPSLKSVKSVCEVSALEERLLRSSEAPIVLLGRRRPVVLTDEKSQRIKDLSGASVGTFHPLEHSLSDSIAPGNPTLGAMLPYTPLHHLLLAELGFPVVATSGNLSDEPICTDEREAVERLREIADVFLVHNRPIVRHVDDSVVRVMLGREFVLRRARGYAPLPITVGTRSTASQTSKEIGDTVERVPPKAILAVGAHLKNTVALAVGPQVFISQHIGDLETEQANNAFRRVIADFERLYDATPEVIAADLHPDYLSTKFAEELAGRAGCPQPAADRAMRTSRPAKIGVQHHLAHVLSCLAENELDPPVLGVAWDGTGHGLDGTIWGGEFFLVTETTVGRVAHLRPFRLPGGDKAVKEPRRAALGVLAEMSSGPGKSLSHLGQGFARAFSSSEMAALHSMLKRGINSPHCSSVGRLFDAVAFLAGLRERVRFEGQAAMELEFALEGVETDKAYPLRIADCGLRNNAKAEVAPVRRPALRSTPAFGINEGGVIAESEIRNPKSEIVLDWAPMIDAILADVKRGVPVGEISAKFHNALAETIVGVARRIGERRVVLSGGCFQNRYLTERSVARLRAAGFQPYWHQRVPPNDGGIALGQIVAARRGFAPTTQSPDSAAK